MKRLTILLLLSVAPALAGEDPKKPKMHTWVESGTGESLPCEAVYLDSSCEESPVNGCYIVPQECCCLMCEPPFCHCADCAIVPVPSWNTATDDAIASGEFAVEVGGTVFTISRQKDGTWLAPGKTLEMFLPGKFAVPEAPEAALECGERD